MDGNWLERTELLIGSEGILRLRDARVAVLGLGGVGSACAEALCRAGIGHLLLIDHDTISLSNLNRQLVATGQTLGMKKAKATHDRLLSINPDGDFTAVDAFYMPQNNAFLYDWKPDYIADAIDTVTAKLHLAQECARRKLPLIASMGTGNRFDPAQLQIGDLSETANGCGCGLARVMRRELHKRGMERQTVLYSREQPQKAVCPDSENGRHAPGSIAFVPPCAGYLIASWIVREILGR